MKAATKSALKGKAQPKAKSAPSTKPLKTAVKTPAKAAAKPVKPSGKAAQAKAKSPQVTPKTLKKTTKAAPTSSRTVAKPAQASASASKPTVKKPPAPQSSAKKPVKKTAAPAAVAPKTAKKPAPAPAHAKARTKPVATSPKTASTPPPRAVAASNKPAVASSTVTPPVSPARPTASPNRVAPTTGLRKGTVIAPPAPLTTPITGAKASFLPSTMPTSIAPPAASSAKKDPKLANNWKAKAATDLSDAEVMAMPDTEYMNDKQMAFFRLKLVQLKRDILASADQTTEHLREDTVIVPDPADRATIEEEHALELRTRDRERKLLKKIEQSIARIDAGDYGYCDETGEPIGVGRLLARPTATLSLEAQQRRELKQRMFGD
jgi:DnaK suppressor protein